MPRKGSVATTGHFDSTGASDHGRAGPERASPRAIAPPRRPFRTAAVRPCPSRRAQPSTGRRLRAAGRRYHPPMTTATCVPEEFLTFLRDLGAHNDKTWFERNKARYERDVVEPARALVRQLARDV